MVPVVSSSDLDSIEGDVRVYDRLDDDETLLDLPHELLDSRCIASQ